MASIVRDQKITVETPTLAGDGYGGSAVSWSTHATAWVSIKPVRANESEQQDVQRVTCIYIVDGLRDELKTVTGDMRINWRNTYLNIREIRLPPETEMMMRLVAETGVVT